MAKNLDPQAEIEAALPDPEERREVLRQLVASIDYADGIAPKAWALSLRPRPGRIFCLTVGDTEVLIFHAGGLRMLLAGPLSDDVLDEFDVARPAKIYNAGGADQYEATLHPRRIEAAQKALDAAHRKFIWFAGTRRSDDAPRAGTRYRDSHRDDLVDYARRADEQNIQNYFVLNWNPSKDPGASIHFDDGTDPKQDSTWSSHAFTTIRLEDVIFLLRTGSIDPGIIGVGRAMADQDVKSRGHVVHVRWHRRVQKPIVAMSDPRLKAMAGLWPAQQSGGRLDKGVVERLLSLVQYALSDVQGPNINEPGDVPGIYPEGRKYEVTLSIFERNTAARLECLDHYKPSHTCQVCNMNFADTYGAEIGDGFIHVHHINPLRNGGRITDATTDLIPVCPNCHAMLHAKRPADEPMKPEVLKKILEKRRKGNANS